MSPRPARERRCRWGRRGSRSRVRCSSRPRCSGCSAPRAAGSTGCASPAASTARSAGAVLHDPDELVAMVGMPPALLGDATRVTSWNSRLPPVRLGRQHVQPQAGVSARRARRPHPDRRLHRRQHADRREHPRAALCRPAPGRRDAAAGRARGGARGGDRGRSRRSRRAAPGARLAHAGGRVRHRRLLRVPRRPLASALAGRPRCSSRRPCWPRRRRSGRCAASS